MFVVVIPQLLVGTINGEMYVGLIKPSCTIYQKF